MTERQKVSVNDMRKSTGEDITGSVNAVFTLKEYAGEGGDVKDPYGGSIMDYEDCFIEIARLVKKVATRIEKEFGL
jgi:protein-tyrosine-phosphatase